MLEAIVLTLFLFTALFYAMETEESPKLHPTTTIYLGVLQWMVRTLELF